MYAMIIIAQNHSKSKHIGCSFREPEKSRGLNVQGLLFRRMTMTISLLAKTVWAARTNGRGWWTCT